ncbi:MAG TPA: cell envelope biogenesis protein OmpA [Methylophaga aminisulfidivorans]|uniref:Cell envelope biogenesis protein OmpA n=2 Tax=root TaxID=1 RepID=A0A7C1W8S6_9GAMM|nr:cell envelope biogenesis protein OmpA [Methylophaga aminisulfidivorans]
MSSEPPAIRQAKKSVGQPRYLATFADLMTLLMCFFVLLLSMAEIDALQFKMVVKSMENAFGVDRPDPVKDIVKGTSIIQQTFSPAPSDKVTPLADIRQNIQSSNENMLKIHDAQVYQIAKANSLTLLLRKKFAKAIEAGLISLETIEDRVIIRINERASFPSGQADLKANFVPVLNYIAKVLAEIDTQFIVSGHSDNLPLRSDIYRSNWELSAARATSVLMTLLKYPELKATQFRIEAYADTMPIRSNLSSKGRAMNRRVEIGIIPP